MYLTFPSQTSRIVSMQDELTQLNVKVPTPIARRYRALAALKGMGQAELMEWLINNNQEARALLALNVLEGGEPQTKKQMSIVR